MSNQTMACEAHGEGFEAMLCNHLLENPKQRWHCDYPSSKNPYPDAWCEKCESAFQREGEWNERNKGEISASLICHHCYEGLQSLSIDRLSDDHLADWNAFIDDCQAELKQKQAGLSDTYSLAKHERYDWDQETGEIIFSNGGIKALIAKVEFVGTLSTTSETWLWSWANTSLLENVRSRISGTRDFGSERDFPHLYVPKWHAAEVDGWEMTAIAAHVLEAQGAYRTPGESGFIYMLLSDVRFAH